MSFDTLFSPINIRGLCLPNRVVMSAMGTHMPAASPDGRSVTDQMIAYHVARVKGGCGLNTTEVCAVDAASAPTGFLSIADDEHIPGLRSLAQAVHQAGGHIALQLWQGSLAVSSDPAAEKLIPSRLSTWPAYNIPEMSQERILSVIDAYGKATARAVAAGFDMLEFHCGHNYLPHSFLSGAFNKRNDQWGGSAENRRRFPLECIKAIRSNMPEDMPLSMRICWQDDQLKDGLTPEEVIDFCKEAGKLGVDLLNVSRGNTVTTANYYEVPPVDLPNGFNVEAAARIRRETGMITMVCGRINTPELAEEILTAGKADMVVMARAQLADANFCNKAKDGKLNSIKYCIGCDQGCYDLFHKSLTDSSIPHITCLRNPLLCQENSRTLKKTSSPKRVLIAGGGIGGIEAADALNTCGHTPILCESGDHLGGQFMLAGRAPRKGDFSMAVDYAVKNVYDEGLDIRLNTSVTPELIEAERPDAVILAVGSSPFVPPIPGHDGENVVNSHEVLSGREVKPGNIVVIGGGLVGIEVAEYLAHRGSHVAVVEMGKAILGDLGFPRRVGTQKAMKQEDITVLLNSACRRITGNSVVVETAGKEKELPADTVVMAAGSRCRDTKALQETCDKLGIPWYLIGSAKEVGFALDAIRDAYDAVLDINQ